VLTLSPAVRVFVVVTPLDMRGSFDALAGAVRRIGLDPTDGHLYLFLNKRRRIAKAVWFDGSGWRVLARGLAVRVLRSRGTPRHTPRRDTRSM
jgi:transposase